MFRKIADSYKKIKDNKGGIIPLLGVSLIIFAFTVALYFVADYVSSDFVRESAVYGWNYLYTDKAGVTPDAELRAFNAQTPILTEPEVRKPNIYLSKTFEPSDKKQTLVLRADHSPMMIKVNGIEVYNNRFETDELAGNCYNAVVLEASQREQEVEVFMKLPLSVRFDASFSNSRNPAFQFSAGFVAGIILALLGLGSLAVFAFASAKRKTPFRSLITSGLLIYTGASVAILNFTEISYIFNAPVWLGASTVFAHLTLVAGILCAVSWFSRPKNYIFAAVFTAGLSLVAVIPSFNVVLFRISTAIMSFLCLACAVYAAVGATRFISIRTQYAAPVFVIIAYYVLTCLLAGAFLNFRNGGMYAFTVSIPTIVLGCVMEFIYISDYRYKLANTEIRSQTVRYGDSVDNISVFIRNMLLCRDEEVFFDTAVAQLCDLLYKYNEKNSDLRYCVGIKTNGGYNELINRDIGGCRYELIERNSLLNDKDCIFTDTYFDFVLRKTSGIYAIIHFENIAEGLDVFFDSMLEAAYCGLETAFEKTCDAQEGRAIDVIFTELAENSEVDNGYSPEHLEHIAKYSEALCKKIGMDDEKAHRIGLAAKLHDIGKIAIPNNIINKDGRLTEEEQVIVSSHAKFGYLILSAYSDEPLLSLAAEIARYHHERYDGSGPNGLKGEDIPLVARIAAICDVYDALVTARPYKEAWNPERVRNFMIENKGVMFDPELTESFLDCLPDIEL